MGHARALVNIPDPNAQLDVYQEIVDKDLSVRKVEDMVRRLNTARGSGKPARNGAKSSLEYDTLRGQLSDYFQADVDFRRNNNGNGRIVIPFKSDQELERILSVLDNLKRI